ncbi:TPA: epimerase [Providencia stuartii]|uniref:epimerase n=1 Tax=Providencia TaxID=586 RepID=UPI00090B067B|nr:MULTISPECIES: epimerase [Providencia]APG49471.1 epimerase [Providencia stuartii]AVL40739.1 epimerase [Providencia stuartii]MBG5903862.1 epimerase [Providencia stuartii]MBG5910990.1 epimerase [Providencia stuartii]MBG5917257.1 epimerase [Providencia stuartii]
MILHPSLASADSLWLGSIINKLANQNIGSLHLDIEDGNFINNITFGIKLVKAVAQATEHALSIHLMVSQPLFWIRELAPFSPKWIFFHPEAVQNPSEIIAEIKKIKAKAGIALNPSTPVAPYQYLINKLDALMLMTSEPDGENQQFIPSIVDKIQQIPPLFSQLEYWADGGISADKIQSLKKVGINNLVIGRALFSTDDYENTIKQLSN